MENKIKEALQTIINKAGEISQAKYGNILGDFIKDLPSLGLKRVVVVDNNDFAFAFSLFHRVVEIEYAISFRNNRYIIYAKIINIDTQDNGDNIGVLCKIINENIEDFTSDIKNLCNQVKNLNGKVDLNVFQCFKT